MSRLDTCRFCGAPIAWICLRDAGKPDEQTYLCAKHPPLPGEYAVALVATREPNPQHLATQLGLFGESTSKK